MTTSKTNNTNNRLKQQVADQKIVDGFTKHAQTITSLVIGGTSYTTTAIIGVLQARLATSTAAQSTRATWQNAVKADLDERAKTKTFMSGLRKALHVAFDGSIDTLADFGLTPPKKRVVTPEQKAAAALKAKATRAARHTMGSKQKAAIKGTVPATAPATTPAAPAPTATPATTPTAPATPAPAVPATAPVTPPRA
jgi:hypothetical protein